MSPRKLTENPSDSVASPERPLRTAPRLRRVVAEAAVPPQRDNQVEGNTRFMSSEEKHQLIMEHASRRTTIDPMQRVALWVGVLVCAIAISGGWAYAMRQSIANAVQSPLGQTLEDFGYGSSADSAEAKQFKSNMQEALKRVGSLEEQTAAEMRTAAAIGQQVMQTASPTQAIQEKSEPAFPLPPGVKTDR